MGWLDANEYFLMEAVARDRLDDIHRTVGVASADDADDTSREIPQRARARGESGVVETCGVRRKPPALGAPDVVRS